MPTPLETLLDATIENPGANALDMLSENERQSLFSSLAPVAERALDSLNAQYNSEMSPHKPSFLGDLVSVKSDTSSESLVADYLGLYNSPAYGGKKKEVLLNARAPSDREGVGSTLFHELGHYLSESIRGGANSDPFIKTLLGDTYYQKHIQGDAEHPVEWDTNPEEIYADYVRSFLRKKHFGESKYFDFDMAMQMLADRASRSKELPSQESGYAEEPLSLSDMLMPRLYGREVTKSGSSRQQTNRR